jgi:MFS transporter, DHA3 family, multidrug efflux protein
MTKNTDKTMQDKSATATFYHLLINTLIVSVINFTVWFAITFFTYLETRSVFATAIISGIYLVATAISGFWFGSIVDHHKKKMAMVVSSLVSLAMYAICFLIYTTAPPEAFKDPSSIPLWVFVVLLMTGVIVGNIRMIALTTVTTILVPEDRRDRANGLVGTASGVSFLITSVISGLLVGHSGMYWVLVLGIGITIASIIHLLTVTIPEKEVEHTEEKPKKIDIRGTLKVVQGVPGLLALILFTTFNNFLGGVFMALMDAYGLSLVSVEMWGFIWGVLSIGFIVGGLVIAKKGLGKNPLKAMFLANVVIWVISATFTVHAWIGWLLIGMFIYLCVIPFIEAAEQTILQKVVPYERQGRVFGFAQSVEQMASPLTAFLIGPIAQFIFIPFMTTGAGVDLIGGWFGTGPDRGIALVFTLTGLIGLAVTLWAFGSRFYRQLSERYLNG